MSFIGLGAKANAGRAVFVVESQNRHAIASQTQFAPHPAVFIYDFKFLCSNHLWFLNGFFG
jgi:hypothetical protein